MARSSWEVSCQPRVSFVHLNKHLFAPRSDTQSMLAHLDPTPSPQLEEFPPGTVSVLHFRQRMLDAHNIQLASIRALFHQSKSSDGFLE